MEGHYWNSSSFLFAGITLRSISSPFAGGFLFAGITLGSISSLFAGIFTVKEPEAYLFFNKLNPLVEKYK